jgi:predicted lipoprotein with Yx(FWY)xxD motif
MKSRSLVVALAAAAALLAACGNSSNSSSSTQPTGTSALATQAPASSGSSGSSASTGAVPVKIAASSLGTILVTDKGMTLYAFTPDSAGKPTCTGGCAQAWPPLMVKSDKLPAGLDAKVFSVYEGAEGSYQLKAGKWPLYTFSGDTAAGQTNGQGSGGSWYVVGPTGQLVKS